MENCIFCKIARGEIPAGKVYEDEHILAFRDINPQAKTHLLLIPKQHLNSLNDLESAPDALLASLLRAANQLAQLAGVAESGYRLVSNCGKDGRQSVGHLHFHLLGGQELSATMS